jgi:AcrR family transcriptional regulator
MRRARTDISKENRRNEILACAENIIIENGLAGLNLKTVAKTCNLAIGTLYLYFPSKEDLIAALTIKSRQLLLEMFEKNISNETSAIEKISKLLGSYYQFYKKYPHYNELVSFFEKNAGLEEPEPLKKASFAINALVIDILKEGKVKKEIRNDLDETTFSFLLWGSAVGIIQLVEVKKSSIKKTLDINEKEFFQQFINMITNSLKG